MNLSDTTALIRSTLDRIYLKYSLIIIHPESHHRALLISGLMQESPCELFYSQLKFEDVHLEAFISGVVRDLGEQNPYAGKYVNMAMSQGIRDEQELAEAFAIDLTNLYPDDYILIFDDFDRVDAIPGVRLFLEHLLRKQPPHCHILLSGRTVPPLPWTTLIARGQVVIIGSDGRLRTGI